MKSNNAPRRRRTGFSGGHHDRATGPIHPRDLLAHLRLSARQSMGQNFLVRPDIARDIVSRAGVGPGSNVLEVGPGLGALTWALRDAGARVVAVEKDRGLAAFLAEQYRVDPGVDVVEADILAWDAASRLEGPDPWMVVANLPYNIATPILFHLLGAGVPFRNLHIMVQREVAERMLARPGTPSYGVLTIRVGILARVEPVLEVAPDAFYPPPKVYSTLVRVTPERRYETGPERRFHRLVNGAFGKRRKTLRNALLAAGLPSGTVDPMLERAGIDGKRRGETLDIAEFCKLNRAIDPG